MIKTIYKAIAECLQEADLGVQFISLWNQEIDQLRQQRAFRLPAVLVEFDPIVWKQRSVSIRGADVGVRLHLLTGTLATPEVGGQYQEKALELLDFVESVGAAMQGLAGDGFNCFMLTGTILDHNHLQVRHDELVYVTHATDLSGVKPQTTISGVELVQG